MYCRNCGNEMNNEAVVCVKCGVPAGKGNGFCPICGAETHPDAVVCMRCGSPLKKSIPNNVAPRNLAVAIILTLVTCGIYGIYWFMKLTDEVNALTGNTNDTSGGMAFLLDLVTCGIYGIYWSYKMGCKQDDYSNGNDTHAILYLVLSLFGFNIVIYALLQDMINKATES